MNVFEQSLALHAQARGKIEINSKVEVESKEDLSLAYSPGVAEPCRVISANEDEVYTYTSKGNMVAGITDGASVLGRGNIGPKVALPVME